MSEIFKFIFRLMIYAADACCSVWKPECFKTEHVSGAWAERSGRKIRWSGAERGAGAVENDGSL